MILYLGAGGKKKFSLGKPDGGFNIYSNFSKIVIETIALAMSDGLMIVSLLTVIAVGKKWLELFEVITFFIPFHIFFRSLIFS